LSARGSMFDFEHAAFNGWCGLAVLSSVKSWHFPSVKRGSNGNQYGLAAGGLYLCSMPRFLRVNFAQERPLNSGPSHMSQHSFFPCSLKFSVFTCVSPDQNVWLVFQHSSTWFENKQIHSPAQNTCYFQAVNVEAHPGPPRDAVVCSISGRMRREQNGYGSVAGGPPCLYASACFFDTQLFEEHCKACSSMPTFDIHCIFQVELKSRFLHTKRFQGGMNKYGLMASGPHLRSILSHVH